MKRLFGCTVTLTYKEGNVERYVNSPITARGTYWWNPDNGTVRGKSQGLKFSTDDRELGRPELTPLGKRGGAVEL